MYVQTAYIGDLLLSIPTLRTLRKLFPSHQLALLCRSGLGSFFQELGLIDRLFEIDKKNWKNWPETHAQLKRQKFDHIISAHQSLRTALICRGLKANHCIGYRRWWNFGFYTERVRRPLEFPEALRQLYLVTPLSNEFAQDFEVIRNQQKNYLVPNKAEKIPRWSQMALSSEQLPLNHPARLKVEQLIGPSDQPTLCIAPGSVWPTKCWPVEYYSDLARELDQRGYRVIILGGKGEENTGETIKRALPKALNLTAICTLLESWLILAKSQALIVNDSGAMHLAAAAGTPTVAIFGPTTLELGYRPWQDQVAICQADLPCRPCGLHGHRVCPLGTHVCMKSQSVKNVLAATLQLLENR